MGTRGLVGFHLDGKNYLSYNHWDSYPSGLGQEVVEFIKSRLSTIEYMKDEVRALKFVNSNDQVPADEIEKYAKYNEGNVGEDGTWYQVLHKTQGNLGLILESGVMTDDRDFALDSLFCEWGYVVNLDAMTLEIYRGFQTSKGVGRFNKYVHKKVPKKWKPKWEKDAYYFPISLIDVSPFHSLTEMDELEARIRAKDEAEQEAVNA